MCDCFCQFAIDMSVVVDCYSREKNSRSEKVWPLLTIALLSTATSVNQLRHSTEGITPEPGSDMPSPTISENLHFVHAPPTTTHTHKRMTGQFTK